MAVAPGAGTAAATAASTAVAATVVAAEAAPGAAATTGARDGVGRPEQRPPAEIGGARRRPPAAVGWATLLLVLVAALWTVAVPAFRPPDEAAHLDLVLYLAEGHPYPGFDGRYFGEAIGLDTEHHLIDSRTPWPRFDAGAAPPRGERPDVDDLGGTEPDADARPTDQDRVDYPYVYNQMPQHPPLYYAGMAGVLGLERLVLPGDGVPSLDRELGLLRLVNVLLVAPLPWLAWLAVARLGGDDRAGVVAALLPLGLPQLVHIGAALNNDNLLLLLGSVLAVLLIGVARGRRTRRTDLAVGVAVGLALLTKAFALMFVPWVVAAYALGAWTTRRRRESAAALAVSGVVAGVVGGWWWIANWVRFGEPAPTTENLTRTGDTRPPGFAPDPAEFLWTFSGRLISRTWAWIGYRTPKFELPSLVVALLTVGVLVAVGVATVRAGAGARPGGRPPPGRPVARVAPERAARPVRGPAGVGAVPDDGAAVVHPGSLPVRRPGGAHGDGGPRCHSRAPPPGGGRRARRGGGIAGLGADRRGAGLVVRRGSPRRARRHAGLEPLAGGTGGRHRAGRPGRGRSHGRHRPPGGRHAVRRRMTAPGAGRAPGGRRSGCWCRARRWPPRPPPAAGRSPGAG